MDLKPGYWRTRRGENRFAIVLVIPSGNDGSLEVWLYGCNVPMSLEDYMDDSEGKLCFLEHIDPSQTYRIN